jgi:hypothetical protein
MTAATLVHGRPARLWAVVFAAALAAGLVTLTVAAGSRAAPPVAAGASPSAPADAVAAWVEGEGETYAGACAEGVGYDGWCSRLVEDLGDRQIHLAGPYATDSGADLLLERSPDGWVVVDSAPWPPVGEDGYLGPPWSPQTAIAAWWAAELPGAVHLRSCAEAAEVAAQAPGQTFLCSTETDDGTWRSGPVGSDDQVVLVLTENADRTFSATRA